MGQNMFMHACIRADDGKSGFTYASEFGIRYHGLPEGYFVDVDEAEEFDKQFPYKQKLPGQLDK